MRCRAEGICESVAEAIIHIAVSLSRRVEDEPAAQQRAGTRDGWRADRGQGEGVAIRVSHDSVGEQCRDPNSQARAGVSGKYNRIMADSRGPIDDLAGGQRVGATGEVAVT